MPLDRLDFGVFLAPFHPVHENPTLSLQRDFELIGWLAVQAIQKEIVHHAEERARKAS